MFRFEVWCYLEFSLDLGFLVLWVWGYGLKVWGCFKMRDVLSLRLVHQHGEWRVRRTSGALVTDVGGYIGIIEGLFRGYIGVISGLYSWTLGYPFWGYVGVILG